MSEIIIEKPSLQKVIYKLEKPSEELAFVYYILFICSHAYSMRERNVLNDEVPNYYITELIDSIRKVGLLHPIAVRVNGNEHFQVVCGCRRYTACKALRWKKIPCIVIDANDREAFEIS